MTVTPYLLIAAWLAIAAFVAFLAGAALNARADANTQRGINVHNNAKRTAHDALLIAAILSKAELPAAPPPLTPEKWGALCDLYDTPDLLPYRIPAQVTTDHDDRPAVYWKITNVNELSAYEIVRLWLAGIL